MYGRERNIQVKVAEANPRFEWINTDDLNDGVNKYGRKIQNDLHLSLIGYKIMGNRFAEKAIKLIRTYENSNTFGLKYYLFWNPRKDSLPVTVKE